jgi:hypothetical protein
MKCETCPVEAHCAVCLGETVPRLCTLATTRADYRVQLIRLADKSSREASQPVLDLDELLCSVRLCSHRGALLPQRLQPECGCAELTECRAGRGSHAGRVTLQDCVACVVDSHSRGSTSAAEL